MVEYVFDELDNKRPFRSVGIPSELLENILLIPAKQGTCPFSPIVKIERKFTFKQVKEMMRLEGEGAQDTGDFVSALVGKDLCLLGELVATNYYRKIRMHNPLWENLYQTVEIDWSVGYVPTDHAVHYEVFTKREIFIKRDED